MGWNFFAEAKNRHEFGKFLLVGLSNTLLTLAIIFVLLRLGVSLFPANLCGYGAGFINSFVWNRRWTFRSRGSLLGEGVRYTFVYVLSYGVQSAALFLCAKILFLSGELSTLLAMPVFTLTNYLGNRQVTFTDKEDC